MWTFEQIRFILYYYRYNIIAPTIGFGLIAWDLSYLKKKERLRLEREKLEQKA